MQCYFKPNLQQGAICESCPTNGHEVPPSVPSESLPPDSLKVPCLGQGFCPLLSPPHPASLRSPLIAIAAQVNAAPFVTLSHLAGCRVSSKIFCPQGGNEWLYQEVHRFSTKRRGSQRASPPSTSQHPIWRLCKQKTKQRMTEGGSQKGSGGGRTRSSNF